MSENETTRPKAFEDWMTVREASVYVNRHERTIMRWVNEGEVECWQHPQLLVWFIRRESLDTKKRK